MPDVYCIIDQTVRLSVPTRKTQLQVPLAYDNMLAHALRVTVINEDGTDAVLNGASVVASMLKSNGDTVTPINGTVSGNVAEVILPASCYATPGRFKLTMNLSSGGQVRTVLWLEGYVEKNVSSTIIDPGTPAENISTVIADAREAADRAWEAYENAEGITDVIAPTFADLMATSPFIALSAYVQHCWKDGHLYVNTVDIDASETWNANHWQEVDISGELSKSPKWTGSEWVGEVATVAETETYLGITEG